MPPSQFVSRSFSPSPLFFLVLKMLSIITPPNFVTAVCFLDLWTFSRSRSVWILRFLARIRHQSLVPYTLRLLFRNFPCLYFAAHGNHTARFPDISLLHPLSARMLSLGWFRSNSVGWLRSDFRPPSVIGVLDTFLCLGPASSSSFSAPSSE